MPVVFVPCAEQPPTPEVVVCDVTIDEMTATLTASGTRPPTPEE